MRLGGGTGGGQLVGNADVAQPVALPAAAGAALEVEVVGHVDAEAGGQVARAAAEVEADEGAGVRFLHEGEAQVVAADRARRLGEAHGARGERGLGVAVAEGGEPAQLLDERGPQIGEVEVGVDVDRATGCRGGRPGRREVQLAAQVWDVGLGNQFRGCTRRF